MTGLLGMKRDGCRGKVRHVTKERACIAAKRTKNCAMNVYRCPRCKAWHIGKTRDPFRLGKRIDQILSRHQRELEARLSPSPAIAQAIGGRG